MEQHERRRKAKQTDEDDELAHRRARGRRAQRAFRQRQVDAIHELRASNEAMQAAIASLARVAARVDSAELNTAVDEACRVAGVNNSVKVSDLEDHEDHDESLPGHNERRANFNEATTGPVSRLHITSALQRPPSPNLRTSHNQWTQKPNQMYRSGRMSPRLSYGVWFEPPTSLAVEYPPIDIIPYLREDKSLASTVFWAGLSWGFRIVGAALGGHNGAIAIAHEIFGTILPMKPDREVLDGLHARLIYRQTGTIDRDHPGNRPELAPRMQAAMERSCEELGTPLDTFLTPVGMENLLRSRLGAAYDVVDRCVRGLGSPEEMGRLRVLVDAMVKTSVCLGDGPRWPIAKATRVLDAWIDDAGEAWHYPLMPAHQRGGGG